MAKQKLTPKKERFVEEYLIDLNATQAALRAGYSKKTAYSQGQRLLKDVEIEGALQKARADLSKRTEISQERVLEELARVGFGNTDDLMEWKDNSVTLTDSEKLTADQRAMIAEVAETKDGVRIKLHNKLTALEKIGQHLGMFKDVKEFTGPDGGPVQVQQLACKIIDPDDDT